MTTYQLSVKALRRTLAAAILIPMSASAQTKRYIDIDADQSKLINDGAAIETKGATYTLATKNDVGTYVFYPEMSTSDALPGRKSSFHFRMGAHPGTTTPGEKMLVNLVETHDAYAPSWGNEKTIGFEVKLGRDYQVQTKDMQMIEWWQGSPYGPPLELLILPNAMTWTIGIENNANNTQKGNPGPEIHLPGSDMEIGKWYHFVVSVTPNYVGNGTVKVWLDGKQVINNSAYPIGYDPSHGFAQGGKPLNSFDVEFGMYRPANSNRPDMYFDSVRWGDTYEDVK